MRSRLGIIHSARAIVIPDNAPVSEIGSLDEVLGLVERDRNLFVMGTIDVQKDRESHIRKLDFLFQTGRIVAMKIFPGHETIYPTDRRLVPVYELCIKYDLPIVIHTGLGSKIPEPGEENNGPTLISVLWLDQEKRGAEDIFGYPC